MCANTNSETEFSRKIVSLLNKKRVVETESLQKFFDGRSRRSVFRDLSGLKYLTSMTHAGRYITLPHIPQFDDNGLWFFQDIGFSVNGPVKGIQGAIHRVVSESDAGQTHEELKKIFRVRIHNALIELINTKRLARVSFGVAERYLYLSAKTVCARKQLERRKRLRHSMTIEKNLSPLVVIQVLVEIVRSGDLHVKASDLCDRMRRAGVEITVEQVDSVLARYDLGLKKTPRFRS